MISLLYTHTLDVVFVFPFFFVVFIFHFRAHHYTITVERIKYGGIKTIHFLCIYVQAKVFILKMRKFHWNSRLLLSILLLQRREEKNDLTYIRLAFILLYSSSFYVDADGCKCLRICANAIALNQCETRMTSTSNILTFANYVRIGANGTETKQMIRP